MVSRRSFLRANGAVLAAGGLGITLPDPAAATGRTDVLLPNFGRPSRLDVAELGSLLAEPFEIVRGDAFFTLLNDDFERRRAH